MEIIATLFKEHFSWLIGVLRRRGKKREEAEDIAQECFERLVVYTRKGENVKNPKALLAKVATHVAIDHQRRERKHLFETRPADELPLPSLTPGPDEIVDTERALDHLAQMLRETIGERACVVYLSHCLGRTHEEIAKAFKISTDTVARDIAKAIGACANNKIELKRVRETGSG